MVFQVTIYKLDHKVLRATACKNRESSDSCEKFDFFIICLKDSYSELFSKIALKGFADFYFWRNREKLKFPSDGLWRPSKWVKNYCFFDCVSRPNKNLQEIENLTVDLSMFELLPHLIWFI